MISEKIAKHDKSRNEYQKSYQLKRYHKRLKDAKSTLGGKCSKCDSTRNLQIDHSDPDNKNFVLTKLWSVAKKDFDKELKKCRLLCKSCHEEHTGKQRENGTVKSVPGKTKYDSNGRKKKKRKKASFMDLALQLLKVANGLASPVKLSEQEARVLGEKLYADWSRTPFPAFYEGVKVELRKEKDKLEAARIALDHLSLDEDYYLKQ